MGRAQGAMEYVTTYGWTLLIVIVALLVLFKLGVFSNSSLPDTCISSSGFICSKVSLDTSGIMRFEFGQSTGNPITITSIGCSSTGATPGNQSTMSSLLVKNGAFVNLTVQCPMPPSIIGTKFVGTIWITFTQGSISYMDNVGDVTATVSTKAIPPVYVEGIVQSASVKTGSGFSVSFPAAVTQGDTLVAVYSTETTSGGCAVASVTDTLGDSWTSVTSKCEKSGAQGGNTWVNSAMFYTTAVGSATDVVSVGTNGGGTVSPSSGLIAIYEISPPVNSVVAASPGFGTSYPGEGYSTAAQLVYAPNSVVIGGTDEFDASGCCNAGGGYSIYSNSGGSASMYSNSVNSPTGFTVTSNNRNVYGWVDIGAAFEPH